ncbi:MAG: LacI family DNA-binding transcriptional regulator [Thermomicrobiales bacterium]
MEKRGSTLKEVAELAGVSTATVARVIHNNGYVADDTRRKVDEILASTGYRINAVAQGLRRQRTQTIGHLLVSMTPNQFFTNVAAGAEEIAAAHQSNVFIIDTGGSVERERMAVETLIQRRVDAILFTVAVHASNVKLALDAGIPVVQVERNRGAKSAFVTADNMGGAHAAVRHLIDLGHRRIAFIGVDPKNMPTDPGLSATRSIEQDRLDGYLIALREAEIPLESSLIRLWPEYFVGGSSHTKNPGYILVNELLDSPSPPTAIFSTLDLVAAGALQALYERGLRVPDDISIVGFDDTYAPFLSPPLTTVDNPMLEMGRTAARLVFEQIENNKTPEQLPDVILPMQLLIRQSTASPK